MRAGSKRSRKTDNAFLFPETLSQARAAPVQAVESAQAAGLRYTTDAKPGLRRTRKGSTFVYLTAEGKVVRDAASLERIRTLVIPPAWTDVWICTDPRGHLQATGRDARGRKQHRYHPRWRQVRDETKYDVDSVAKRLGNTKAVCRKCYIHPAVFEAFMDGSLVKVRARVTRRIGALSEPEAAVLAMLQRRLRAATDRRAS